MTMRNDKSAMNLEVEELGSVVVMRPIHPNDGLFVEYSDTSIGIVIKFLRESGFDESLATTHEPSLPKGTLKRQSQFLVKYTKNDGNTALSAAPRAQGGWSRQDGGSREGRLPEGHVMLQPMRLLEQDDPPHLKPPSHYGPLPRSFVVVGRNKPW